MISVRNTELSDISRPGNTQQSTQETFSNLLTSNEIIQMNEVQSHSSLQEELIFVNRNPSLNVITHFSLAYLEANQ